MGTTLALTGAYVLAGELSRNPDLSSALAAYEQRLRPLVDKAQKLPPGVPDIANPETEAGIAAVHLVEKAAASKVATVVDAASAVTETVGKIFGSSDGDFQLPDYDHLTQQQPTEIGG
jgi:hypothetical protein